MGKASWSCLVSPTVTRTLSESLRVGSSKIKTPLTGLLSPAKGGFRDRIEAIDSRIHSFVLVTREEALRQAKTAEREIASNRYRGPMHGIPIGLKDLIETAAIRKASRSVMRGGGSPTRVLRLDNHRKRAPSYGIAASIDRRYR